MKNFDAKICPRCGVGRLKSWSKLSDEEKIVAEKMPLSATVSLAERKRHLFCPRCWQEIVNRSENELV